MKIGHRKLYTNEAVSVAIEISDFEKCDEPQVPRLAGYAMRQLPDTSEASYTSIVGGRVTKRRTLTYHYELTALKTGELVIPPIPVSVDGETLETREVRMEVRPSNAAELLIVEISAGRGRLYVGQRIPLTMTIWVKPARYGNQLLGPGQMLRQLRATDFGPFPLEMRNRSNVRRQRKVGDREELFYAYEFSTDFIADQPGQLSFSQIEVGLAYPTPEGTRNLRARAVVEPTEILPVPMEGRPANFNGAVGLFDIQTSASPIDVRVGDPIELTIDILGEGPVETLPPPLLSAQPGIRDGFRLPQSQLAGEMVKGRRRFKLTIRAERDDIAAIPSIEYPYFDPDAERFVIARSEPLPLNVAPAAEVAAPDLRSASPPQATVGPTQLETLDGLHDVETSEAALLARTGSLSPNLIAWVMTAPPAVFAVVWIGLAYAQRRGGDPSRRRRQSALRAARACIAQASGRAPRDLAGGIATALSGYVADRLDEPPARLVGSAALDALRQREVPQDLVEKWAAILKRCERASFAGGTEADGEALRGEALACLAALERHKL